MGTTGRTRGLTNGIAIDLARSHFSALLYHATTNIRAGLPLRFAELGVTTNVPRLGLGGGTLRLPVTVTPRHQWAMVRVNGETALK
ncbi:MAG: hypothetical protein ACP5JH_07330 [Bacteroidota bacterium]